MSRSGYSENCSNWELIRWRGAVASAIRGRRGQQFLQKMLAALDALPHKRLIAHEIEKDGDVCALGSVARARSLDATSLDPYDHEGLGKAFDISSKLVQEIEFINDEIWYTPEERFIGVRKWIIQQILQQTEKP